LKDRLRDGKSIQSPSTLSSYAVASILIALEKQVEAKLN
jgi:hypothetical protein